MVGMGFPEPKGRSFLVLLREAYGREREARVRAKGGDACGERPSSLGQLALSESDIERLRA